MKRTTIYLDPALEVRLKMEGLRRKQPMAELVREAVEVYLAGGSAAGPPGGGSFASGRDDTAADTYAALRDSGFGRSDGRDATRPRQAGRTQRVRKRRA